MIILITAVVPEEEGHIWDGCGLTVMRQFRGNFRSSVRWHVCCRCSLEIVSCNSSSSSSVVTLVAVVVVVVGLVVVVSREHFISHS